MKGNQTHLMEIHLTVHYREAIDSSLWRVYAQDDKVLRRLQEAFQEVHILEVPFC